LAEAGVGKKALLPGSAEGESRQEGDRKNSPYNELLNITFADHLRQ